MGARRRAPQWAAALILCRRLKAQGDSGAWVEISLSHLLHGAALPLAEAGLALERPDAFRHPGLAEKHKKEAARAHLRIRLLAARARSWLLSLKIV